MSSVQQRPATHQDGQKHRPSNDPPDESVGVDVPASMEESLMRRWNQTLNFMRARQAFCLLSQRFLAAEAAAPEAGGGMLCCLLVTTSLPPSLPSVL